MIDIKIEKVNFKIPGSWDEVTVKQFSELVDHASGLNPVRVLAIFTDLDYDALNNYDCTGFTENVLPHIAWVRTPLDLSALPRKEQITIGDMKVKVITHPGKERIGQKLNMTTLIMEAEKSGAGIPSIMPGVLANYYAPYLREDKLWKEEHVKEIEPLIWKMKITEAAPECNFFLTGYIKSLRSKPKHSMSAPAN